jgi:hypothetical protein
MRSAHVSSGTAGIPARLSLVEMGGKPPASRKHVPPTWSAGIPARLSLVEMGDKPPLPESTRHPLGPRASLPASRLTMGASPPLPEGTRHHLGPRASLPASRLTMGASPPLPEGTRHRRRGRRAAPAVGPAPGPRWLTVGARVSCPLPSKLWVTCCICVAQDVRVGGMPPLPGKHAPPPWSAGIPARLSLDDGRKPPAPRTHAPSPWSAGIPARLSLDDGRKPPAPGRHAPSPWSAGIPARLSLEDRRKPPLPEGTRHRLGPRASLPASRLKTGASPRSRKARTTALVRGHPCPPLA